MGAYVPISTALFLVIYLGRHQLFEWTEHPVAGKEFWYEPTFTFTRDIAALLWVTFISLLYLYMTVRPMLGPRARVGDGLRGTLYQRWTARLARRGARARALPSAAPASSPRCSCSRTPSATR